MRGHWLMGVVLALLWNGAVCEVKSQIDIRTIFEKKNRNGRRSATAMLALQGQVLNRGFFQLKLAVSHLRL
ncbi:hypothetical protein BDP81DRAFT_420366 [Colletotrichum phormii]|uniref:Uncharacterized protein n=1 Tax=Colletotrichum phormii TaxID=359342 RepID=A0AAJ0EHL2_9PEZI|nr:uncharacterized protein BDP81DRAFT_420366 [Colletotrichum phormii]KAK1640597.1 hypothetical protein BDP81DRAFT_420366 [Colletotrichum phormii]